MNRSGSAPRGEGGYGCVVFLHIPKTAGQTMNAILARQYDPAGTVVIANPLDPFTPFNEVAGRALPSLIRGHLPYGIHETLGIEATYITILRNPVSRVQSIYDYIRRAPRHPLHATLHQRSMTFAQFITSDIDRVEVVNGQTRLIAGQTSTDPDDLTLSHAKENLRRMAAVGVTERFDETIILFRHRLHWTLPFYVSKNVAPVRTQPDASPEVRQLLASTNEYDMELYHSAVSRFDHDIESIGKARFAREVTLFRVLNRAARSFAHLQSVKRRRLAPYD